MRFLRLCDSLPPLHRALSASVLRKEVPLLTQRPPARGVEAHVTEREILRVANTLHMRYVDGGRHNPAITKAVTGMMGLAAGPVRPPLSWPEPEELEEARLILEEAGLVDQRAAL